jgi:hypothetical protein
MEHQEVQGDGPHEPDPCNLIAGNRAADTARFSARTHDALLRSCGSVLTIELSSARRRRRLFEMTGLSCYLKHEGITQPALGGPAAGVTSLRRFKAFGTTGGLANLTARSRATESGV